MGRRADGITDRKRRMGLWAIKEGWAGGLTDRKSGWVDGWDNGQGKSGGWTDGTMSKQRGVDRRGEADEWVDGATLQERWMRGRVGQQATTGGWEGMWVGVVGGWVGGMGEAVDAWADGTPTDGWVGGLMGWWISVCVGGGVDWRADGITDNNMTC